MAVETDIQTDDKSVDDTKDTKDTKDTDSTGNTDNTDNTDNTTPIVLPNGRILNASKEDLILLATVGAAEELKRQMDAVTKKNDTTASDASGDSNGNNAEVRKLQKQFDEFKAGIENEKSQGRFENRKREILSTISTSLANNPIVVDDNDLRTNIQAQIFDHILQNPKKSVQQAVDSIIISYENFAKRYRTRKTTDKSITHNTPTGGSGGSAETPKSFTLDDMKSGKIRSAITEKLKKASHEGAFTA